MTAEQIKKLAAAGLTVEQIAAVAEIMEPQGHLGGLWGAMKPPGARKWPESPGDEYWEGKELGLPKGHLVHLTRPKDRIETKVQHGELTVWPEKTKEDYVKAYNEENRP